MNESEVIVALAHAKRLVESGIDFSDIGIITPYAAQVGLLKMMRRKEMKLKDLEISTVVLNPKRQVPLPQIPETDEVTGVQSFCAE